jgi:hypothetical protein
MAELSAEAKAEIAEAARILRDDGVHIHRTYAAFQKSQQADGDKEPPEGGPPPVKDPPEDDYEDVVGLWGPKRVKKNAGDKS